MCLMSACVMEIPPFENKCEAGLITTELISDREKGLCLLWRCKHSVKLNAYWLISNYAGTQRTS